MLRPGIAILAIATTALGAGFTFTIGSPVASQDFHFKAAAFVFRTEGCDQPAPQITAAAEGLVNGERRSVALKVLPAGKPGVYGVFQTWPAEGQWVVVLKGACRSMNAGAIIPIGPKGFIRESSKFFPRPATDSEIDQSLKGQGSHK